MERHGAGGDACAQSETVDSSRQPMAELEDIRERHLPCRGMDTRSEPKTAPPAPQADPVTPPREPHEGQGEEDSANVALDPHPDNDDDFEGDDGGRQSEEALLENPGH
jgi:hypothetical protein